MSIPRADGFMDFVKQAKTEKDMTLSFVDQDLTIECFNAKSETKEVTKDLVLENIVGFSFNSYIDRNGNNAIRILIFVSIKDNVIAYSTSGKGILMSLVEAAEFTDGDFNKIDKLKFGEAKTSSNQTVKTCGVFLKK